jgi:hypothetical protein
MTDERRKEMLAMRYYRLQAELLRIETAMFRVPFSRWPWEVVQEYQALEGALEINDGTHEVSLTGHPLQTREQWGGADG